MEPRLLDDKLPKSYVMVLYKGYMHSPTIPSQSGKSGTIRESNQASGVSKAH